MCDCYNDGMTSIDFELPGRPVPAGAYAERRERLRAQIRSAGLDCLFVTDAADRFYLSGFELHDGQPGESSGCLVIGADGADWLATDSRYKIAAERVWDPGRIVIYGANRLARLAELLNRCGMLIGIKSAAMSLRDARKIRSGLGRGRSLVPCSDFVARMREIKSPEELVALRQSFKLNHAMFDWLQTGLDNATLTGISENALAWEIEKFFRSNGASELAFAVIAAAAKNGALPHAAPSASVPVSAGPLLVDAGCRVADYCSDQTRSYWVGGEPSAQFKAARKLASEAQAAAIAVMKPGVACADVYAAAMDIFKKAGVEKAFTHGLGHGVGLETHEAPSLSPASTQKLKPGMVVTVEPGLYYPEWGGVRIEHTVVVEEDGVAIL